ncbi:2Fe-2S iron-sulfur cluster-binding protein [Rhodococcus qingshengii]|uniref:2Fe-2S iron-sulfur cluster-binding protein n=1 Tax=Rhodococcus erythropolis group TaxID=2840174 RepID=UPI0002D9D326|nr:MULTISPECIES: 2Fe-2S iron-sulfur cluster-binding protein [Rhodococcus erythropolis group]ALU73400.1 ferredoxin [Rhodococcus erythropolis R138]MCD2109257.1 2Fe-2S iron-sulfur cluster-binding protein [Rhodococcus qingshengii]MCZ4528181.1 2Fe-2S iron-sulfur cluster-binding protein [Rhodococcus erythropolis]
MVNVTYVLSDGSHRSVDGQIGQSVMETAIGADIDGITGECGGNVMCATCHVHVQNAADTVLPTMQPEEEEMLQCTTSPRSNDSRLSCQLVLDETLNGLVVRLPQEQ